MLKRCSGLAKRAASASEQAHSWTKFQKSAKNEIPKIREIDESYLCLQRFQILNVKRRQPKTEVMWICRNFHGKTPEITLGELMLWRIFDIWKHCEAASSKPPYHPPTKKNFTRKTAVASPLSCFESNISRLQSVSVSALLSQMTWRMQAYLSVIRF